MSTDVKNNRQSSAATSEPSPTRRIHETLETELTHEAADARDALAETAEALAHGLLRALDPRPAVSRHPVAAVGIGAAGGLLAGMLLGRRAARRNQPPRASPTVAAVPEGPAVAGVTAKGSGIGAMLFRAAISAGSQFVLDALMKQAAEQQAAAAAQQADPSEADYDDFPRDEV
jgi:ElaB/YqjD/DUF883 family membrane-anchored ribosome-binding protein